MRSHSAGVTRRCLERSPSSESLGDGVLARGRRLVRRSCSSDDMYSSAGRARVPSRRSRASCESPSRTSSLDDLSSLLECARDQKPPVSRRSSLVTVICEKPGTPVKEQKSLEKKALGSLAACLLAGSSATELIAEPEVGALLASGHVDMLSAKVCTMPALDVPNAPPLSSLNPPPDAPKDGLRAFLLDSGSKEAEEASCLGSGTWEEEPLSPSGELNRGRVQVRARRNAAKPRVESRQEVLESLDDDESEQSPSARIQRSRRRGSLQSPTGPPRNPELASSLERWRLG